MHEFSIHRREGLVAPSGEVDLATAPELSAALVDACREATADVVVDLSRVTFMDSCGARSLITAARHLPPGVSLEVVGQTGIVDRALRILGLDAVEGIRFRRARTPSSRAPSTA